jgi:predicted site-specific integrase-resolvase
MSRLLTLKGVAAELGVSYSKAKRLRAAGELPEPACRRWGKLLWDWSDVKDLQRVWRCAGDREALAWEREFREMLN